MVKAESEFSALGDQQKGATETGRWRTRREGVIDETRSLREQGQRGLTEIKF